MTIRVRTTEGPADLPRNESAKLTRPGAERVPVEALELLEATWVRCRMGGMRLAQQKRWAWRLSNVTTAIAAVTSLSIFAALGDLSDNLSRTIFGSVTAAAAVISAIQTKFATDAQNEVEKLHALKGRFHPLHEELLTAISQCMEDGSRINPDLLARARSARAAHVIDMGSEQQQFDCATKSVHFSLDELGLNRGHLAWDTRDR